MFKLIAVKDMREFDYLRQEYIPLEKGSGNICDRCGREHAKVYVVNAPQENRDYYVGSTCCKKLLNWEPANEEVQVFMKQQKDTQKAESKHCIQEFIQNAVTTLVKEAVKINKEQGSISHSQIDQMALQQSGQVFSGTKQEILAEKIVRKFWGTPCQLVVR
ncbi:MAG TPA: hypothetical protein VHV10_02745 [Ktedonobacteraceae bacterium]|nr:hypothetical protein [Ktedonobacteraceae bacterium]